MNYINKCLDASSKPEKQGQKNEGEAELIASDMLTDRFDYTEWRRIFVDKIDTFDDLESFCKACGSVDFGGKADNII